MTKKQHIEKLMQDVDISVWPDERGSSSRVIAFVNVGNKHYFTLNKTAYYRDLSAWKARKKIVEAEQELLAEVRATLMQLQQLFIATEYED